MSWHLDRLCVDATADKGPRGERVRVPHFARAEFVPAPHDPRDLRNHSENSTSDVRVFGNAPWADAPRQENERSQNSLRFLEAEAEGTRSIAKASSGPRGAMCKRRAEREPRWQAESAASLRRPNSLGEGLFSRLPNSGIAQLSDSANQPSGDRPHASAAFCEGGAGLLRRLCPDVRRRGSAARLALSPKQVGDDAPQPAPRRRALAVIERGRHLCLLQLVDLEGGLLGCASVTE
jgi:hypothetical protein